MRFFHCLLGLYIATVGVFALGQTTQDVVDVPTRVGVTNRILVLAPPKPKATLMLMAGGHGGLQMFPNGSILWGEGNFLVRSKQLFANQGVAVIVVDAPSDRQFAPFLVGFRQTREHAADLKAIIAWTRENLKTPVWVVGTSNGTLSTAAMALELQGADAPDGIVLTSSVLRLPSGGGRPVPEMPLEKIHIPVLVVHHENDACQWCQFKHLQGLTSKLTNSPRVELMTFTGGVANGDPCEAFHYHGFNGLEAQVAQRMVAWITSP